MAIGKAPVGDGGPIRWNPAAGGNSPDERASEMMVSPAGRAFAVIAAHSGLGVAELAAPNAAVWLGAEVSGETEVWSATRDETLAYLGREAHGHADILRRILALPAAAWWFEPLRRDSQTWVSHDGSPPSEGEFVAPTAPLTHWERYAQKSAGGIYTSTMYGDISPMLAAIGYGAGDLRPAFEKPPYAVWRMDVDDSARIYEIDGAHAWHRLCVEYPAEGNVGGRAGNEPDFSRDPRKLVPNWPAVAGDWDAVHLSFGGYLAAEQVRVESDAGWTYHWAWDCESTLWLRWKFTGCERMEDRSPEASLPDFGGERLWSLVRAAESRSHRALYRRG